MDPPLDTFVLEKVLSDDGRSKSVAALGTFEGKPGKAVLLLSKRHFAVKSLSTLPAHLGSLQLLFNNDVYSKFTGGVPPEEATINVDIIYPATEKHISKYAEQRYFLIQETPAQYKAVTKPFIDSISPFRVQWVYNILDGKAEANRIVFADRHPETGFILVPDQKWDESQVEELYLQAIAFRRDVKSLRDLTAAHLPLLQNIRSHCRKAVKDKYGVDQSELRLWMHYQPSYYHLHCHCAHTKWDGYGLQVAKAILLDDIIDNLEAIDGEYYSKRTLTYTLGERDPLLAAFKQAGNISDSTA